MFQGLFFVFGVLALYGISLITKPVREYRNPLLGLMILWALASVFMHRTAFLNNSYVIQYVNYSMLAEGFIYVLASCILVRLVITHSKFFDIFYPLFGINVLNLFFVITQQKGIDLIWEKVPTICGLLGTSSNLCVFSAISVPILAKKKWYLALIPLYIIFAVRSFTGALALIIATIIYLCLIKNKAIKHSGVFMRDWVEARYDHFIATCVLIGIIFCQFNFHSLKTKLMIRLELWATAVKDITWIGKGFDIGLTRNMIYSKLDNGMTYIHNDYLNIARDLGIVFLVLIVLNILNVLKRAKIDYLLVAVMILIIGCFFQTSFYFSRIASVGLIILALKVKNDKP